MEDGIERREEHAWQGCSSGNDGAKIEAVGKEGGWKSELDERWKVKQTSDKDERELTVIEISPEKVLDIFEQLKEV